MYHKIKTIAIFRALYLGDMLCIIPTVRAVRHAYPTAFITLIGLPWQKDFVNRFPQYFDEFISFPGWPGLPEQKTESKKITDFLHEIRSRRFDLLLQMQGNGEITNKMCLLWNARILCGLRRQGEFSSNSALFPVSGDGDHEVLRFLKLLDALGIPEAGTDLEFPILASEERGFNKISARLHLISGQYICVHAGARDPKRRWSVSNFAIVCDYFARQGFQIVLTGSQEELELLHQVQRSVSVPVVNSVEVLNNISLGELSCIIQHSILLISNDTGVSHISAALKKPSVIIFSPYSDIQRWAPLDTALHQSIPHAMADPAIVIQSTEHQLMKNHLKVRDTIDEVRNTR